MKGGGAGGDVTGAVCLLKCVWSGGGEDGM